MNRYLLAGCAAVALAMASGAANAQAKFEVKVGGDVFFEAGYVDAEVDPARSLDLRNRFRVNLIPSAKADNGLEYGARLRFRAFQGAAVNANLVDLDRAYVFVQGGFGQVRLGQTNSFNDETYVTAPMDYLPFAVYNIAENWIDAATPGVPNLYPGMDPNGNATKVVYFTPRIAGFQGGVSYQARTDSNNGDINLGPVTTGFEDVYEVGANYNATFGSVAVKASAGYMWGDAASGRKDLRAWQAGAQVGFGPIAVGGSFLNTGKSGTVIGTAIEQSQMWVAGVQYTTGPIVVGANFKQGWDTADNEIKTYELGAGYTVAPGFVVQANYDYFQAEYRAAATRDRDGHVILLRTNLAF